MLMSSSVLPHLLLTSSILPRHLLTSSFILPHHMMMSPSVLPHHMLASSSVLPRYMLTSSFISPHHHLYCHIIMLMSVPHQCLTATSYYMVYHVIHMDDTWHPLVIPRQHYTNFASFTYFMKTSYGHIFVTVTLFDESFALLEISHRAL